jgi:hypothetical protein
VEGPTGIIISIAGWMFDSVACAKMVVGMPCIDLATLLALKQVLMASRPPRDSPNDKGFVREKRDEALRVADGNCGSADEPAVRPTVSTDWRLWNEAKSPPPWRAAGVRVEELDDDKL